jgi:hypothetical protein
MGVIVSDGIDVGGLLIDALRLVDVSHKEAGLCCGVDASQFARAIRGKAPLDLWKLRHLPKRVWPVFMAQMASALIVHWWCQEMTEHTSVRTRPAVAPVLEVRP